MQNLSPKIKKTPKKRIILVDVLVHGNDAVIINSPAWEKFVHATIEYRDMQHVDSKIKKGAFEMKNTKEPTVKKSSVLGQSRLWRGCCPSP